MPKQTKTLAVKLYILAVICFSFASCFDCKTYYTNKIRPVEVSGVVDSIFVNKNNHGSETILFKNQFGNGITGGWILGLFENTQKGDSIYKAKGSLAVYLYKSDTTLLFYPVCNGDTLK